MANILFEGQPFVSVGLGTFTHTVVNDGVKSVRVQSFETPASSLSIVVNKNGSPVFTAPTITPTQSALQFKATFICVATDVVTVVLSSGAAVDNQLNTLKTTVSFDKGE